jgi:hypothetical protein
MADLDKRLRKLEEYQADTTPEGVPVCVSDDPTEVQAFKELHKGKPAVIVMTRCARKCTDDCTDRGGHSCRDTQEVDNESDI